MKYLLLLLVVMGLVFLSGVRKGRSGGGAATGAGAGAGAEGAPRHPPATKGADLMVSCAECGTHLPQAEAYPGRGGHFCSAEHRQRHEARHGHG